MNDTSLMKIVETRENLADKVTNKSLFEGSIVVEQRSNGTTWNVFQENVQMVAVRGRVYRSTPRMYGISLPRYCTIFSC